MLNCAYKPHCYINQNSTIRIVGALRILILLTGLKQFQNNFLPPYGINPPFYVYLLSNKNIKLLRYLFVISHLKPLVHILVEVQSFNETIVPTINTPRLYINLCLVLCQRSLTFNTWAITYNLK